MRTGSLSLLLKAHTEDSESKKEIKNIPFLIARLMFQLENMENFEV